MEATAATMARKQRHATRGQLAHRSAHVLAALERAQAAKQAAKDGKCWKCTAKHEREHEAESCRRVHSNRPQWFEREPGWFDREELPHALTSPASVPTFADRSERYMPPRFAEVWRDTWKMAQQVPVRVNYHDRETFLAALRCLNLAWTPKGDA